MERETVFADEHADDRMLQPRLRLLAPLDSEQDRLQPENQAKADRLRTLTPRELTITARTDQQVNGGLTLDCQR